jgi:hypothetical protein
VVRAFGASFRLPPVNSDVRAQAEKSMLLKDPNLHRYWFAIPGMAGIGVTAYSLADAESLARDACAGLGAIFEPTNVVEDVDVRDLDQNHIVPNIGPVNFRGVWYPALNV